MSIKVKQGAIAKLRKVDIIVNPANGLGLQRTQISKLIVEEAGELYAQEVRQSVLLRGKPYNIGEVYLTSSGELEKKRKVTGVLHAVMTQLPNDHTTLGTLEQCLESIFAFCVEGGFKSVAIPNLGDGHAQLDLGTVAYRTVQNARRYEKQIETIWLISEDSDFVHQLDRNMLI